MNITINTVETHPDTGDLIVTVTMPLSVLGHTEATEHAIIISEAALDDRARIYGLANRDEAIQAILREHAKRLNALPDGDESPAIPMLDTLGPVRQMGGLRSDVTIVRGEALVSPEAMAMLGLRTQGE